MSAKLPPLPKRLLTPSEREGLGQRIRDHEEDTKRDTDPHGYTPHRVNDPLEQRAIDRAKNVLKRGDPNNLDLGRQDRARLQERVKELTARLKKMMIPRSHINLRASPDPEFRKAVNEMAKTEMSPEFQRMAVEYKNIQRALFPDDPNAANLEHIRPLER